MPPGLMEDVDGQRTAVTPTSVSLETVKPSPAVRECTSSLIDSHRYDERYINTYARSLTVRIAVGNDGR